MWKQYKNITKRMRVLFFTGMLCFLLAACGEEEEPVLIVEPISVAEDAETEELTGEATPNKKAAKSSKPTTEEATSEEENLTFESVVTSGSAVNIIQDAGETLETRVLTPSGYERVEVEEGSFEEFLRQYPLKPAGSKVLLYDGSEKGNQSAHVAVFALPIENYDLQQCADSVLRMYAEYFWAIEQYDRIKFLFTNGFLVEYTKWRE